MSDPAPLETGRWYSFRGGARPGRPVCIRHYERGFVLGRFADGSERLLRRGDIGGQVEDAVPGVTEPCSVCGGEQVLPILLDTTEEDPSEAVEARPCPNCRGLH